MEFVSFEKLYICLIELKVRRDSYMGRRKGIEPLHTSATN